jgi:tetratricopeptide (TPR) repeat protein
MSEGSKDRPLPPLTARLLAVALRAVKEDTRAVAVLQASHVLHPNDPVLNWALGNVYSDAPWQAVAYYEALRAARPETGCALARQLVELKRFDEARAVCRELRSLSPDSISPRFVMADAAIRQNRWDEAAGLLRDCLALESGRPELIAGHGACLLALGRLEEGLAEMTRARGALALTSPGELTAAIKLMEKYALFLTRFRANPRASFADLRFSDKEWGQAARTCEDMEYFAAASRAREERRAAEPEAALYAFPLPLFRDGRMVTDDELTEYYAARAGAGASRDSAWLPDDYRRELREHARQWLGERLAAHGNSLRDTDRHRRDAEWNARRTVDEILGGWKKSADLEGVREPGSLAKLPEDERADWQRLWAGVDALLAEAKKPAAKSP